MNVVTGEVDIRTFRLELSRYLAAVQQRQEVLVADHGRLVARLIPAQTAKDDWLPEPIQLAPDVTISDLVAKQRR